MNRNQSVMSSASEKNGSQPDQELLNMISDWKSKTRVGKFDRIKKMVFSFNQRPTDFKPADFFPPIPDLEIASDSEEKTIDKLDRERKSLSKRKLDYENLVEIDQVIENQATPEEINGSSLNDNEKQRRQPVSNEFTDLKQFSPINSPTQTNRNLIKLNRESLLKQVQNDENLQMCNQHLKNSDDKELNISLKGNSILESRSKLNSNKNPTQLSNVHDHDEPIQKSNSSSVNKDRSSSLNKSKSDQQIEAQLDKENIVTKSSNNNESNLFNPPTPPQAQSIQNHQHDLQILENQAATRSSITITKRRSAEPVRDILVDLSNVSAKPKVLNKQKAVTKFNASMNESQTELLMSQSNTYIRRRSTFNNKTSNSTVNSSASVLFKPVKSNKAKDLVNLPQAPLFTHEKHDNLREHETSTENSSSLEIKRKKVRNKRTTKQKQQQKLKENNSKNSDAIDSTNKEQKESKTNTNDKEKDQAVNECKNSSLNNEDLMSEKQVVIEQNETNQKSTENRKKSSKNNNNDDDDVNNVNLKLIDKSCSKVNQQISPLIKTKNISKQQKKNKTNSSPKKNKNTKSRQPLKNIQNQEEKVYKTRANSQKDIGYFLNNKTVPYEQKLIEECENEAPLSLRRSKRAKIDKNLQPIYGYEEISDYMGNKCIVRKVIGTKDKINIKINKELMRLNHHFTQTNKNKPKEKNKKTNSKNLDKTQTKISDAFKKLEKTQENLLKETNNQINHDLISDPIEEPNRPNHLEANVNLVLPNTVINDDQQANVNLTDQDNILQVENSALLIEESLSISVNSNVNSSMEFIFSKKDGATIPINPYFFHKNIEKKSFQHYSKGVQISPISDMTGVLRINGLSSTKTNYHDFAVNYFVQDGSFLFSLNGILSIHHEKDVIYIPKNTPYKIKNVSDNEENFAYVYFRFEN